MATVKHCDRCHAELEGETRLNLEVSLGAGEQGQLVPMLLRAPRILVTMLPKILTGFATESEKWRVIDLCIVCQLAVLEHAYRQAQGSITPIRRFVEHPPAPTYTVHILRAGWTFCGWDEEPHHWPSDHRWVEESHADMATCSGCLEVKRAKEVANG